MGFISLRQALNNAEVLAVAYEYTFNGETYQVGTLVSGRVRRARRVDLEDAEVVGDPGGSSTTETKRRFGAP